MIETIGTACHERHQQSSAHEQRCRILVPFESLADILQQRKVWEQRLYLLTPLVKLGVHDLSLTLSCRRGNGHPPTGGARGGH